MKSVPYLLCLTLCFLVANGSAQTGLFQNFQSPPPSAKPLVWWHWTGSNVTKEGITKDLEWMQRSGVGGFQMFDVSLGFGQTVEKKVKFMTPEWLELLRHSAAEADRLGLEMTLVPAAGWSETGGTWVKPEEAMKKLSWSQLQIVGGKPFSGKLPLPPNTVGPIRNLARASSVELFREKYQPLYVDQKVVAFKTPDAELTQQTPQITNHKGESLNARFLLDDDLNSKITLEVPKPNKPVFLQFEYEQPFTVRAFAFAMSGFAMFPSKLMRPGYVEYSIDGVSYHYLVALPGAQHDIRALPVRTLAFPEVTARFFRVVFIAGSAISTVGGPDDPGGFPGFGVIPAPTTFDVSEAIFQPGARVNRWEDKANFAPMFAFESLKTPNVAAPLSIPSKDILDLSDKLEDDGSFNWDAPTGNWTILRLGYSLTGATNGPAIPEATGLEVDKLSKKHLTSHMNQWADPIAKALGSLFGKSLKYYLIDSYEADAQNWTETLIPEFLSRRGYNPLPYLPVLTGRVVENAEISDRFLWDFRLTLAEMLAENHYAALTELAHQKGIKTYGEVAGISLPIIEDALRNKGSVDIPMGEFGMTQGLGDDSEWTSPDDLEKTGVYRGANDRLNAHQADVREAASASHIYGKKVVAAESWTGGGYEAPADMKFIADYWATQGINQFIVHTSAHQPFDKKPGNVMVGTHFNRNITWAELAKPFTTYLARNQYLLQEGRFVADIAYFLGEDIPVVAPYWQKLSVEIPKGHDYDFINTEILQKFDVQDGELVLPSGMRYKLLVLPNKITMSPSVLNKIADLVQKGASILGPKPEKAPGLAGYPEADLQVQRKAKELWGLADGVFLYQNQFGKGNVYWNASIAGIFAKMGLKKDLEFNLPHANTQLNWIHRKIDNAELYFLLNLRNQEEELEVSFRVSDKIPERWNADRGTAEALSYRIENGLTFVKLRLAAQESAFIVFQKTVSQQIRTLPEKKVRVLSILKGPWKLSFPANQGAPAQVNLAELSSWTSNPDPGVKYFSGTATYSNFFDLKSLKSQSSIVLDLGVIKDIASVIINGQEVAVLWKAPYSCDITKVLKEGRNTIDIKVTNQWVNRIVGDKQPGIKTKVTQTDIPFYQANSPLKLSGLLTPVRILSITN